MAHATRSIMTAIAAMGGLIAANAFAQGYLGVGVGQGHVSIPSASATSAGITVTATEDKTSATAYKIYGGFQFTPNWGIEAGYNDLGNKYSARITGTNSTQSVSGTLTGKVTNWYVAGTGTLPLDGGFSLFAKLGAVRNTGSFDNFCVQGQCVSGGDTHRSQVLIGAGAEYAINKQFGVRLEYEDYGKISDDDVWGTGGSGAIKANAWNISLKYTFF